MMQHHIYFKLEDLMKYFKSLKVIKGKDYEILIALTIRKAYRKVYEDRLPDDMSMRIGFPLKDGSEKEFPENYNVPINDIGKWIEKLSQQSTLTDLVFGVEMENKKTSLLFVFQIKQFGLGNEAGGGTKEFISFLEKRIGDSATNERLIIHLERHGSINTDELIKWFNKTEFPYKEVILIDILYEDDKFEFIQILPNRGKPAHQIFSREEIVTI